ncbi:hypothetical protein BpJC7_06520 [Weizmannia acidilactici]|uniref:DUF4021 domain-containing protein n=1 Tax=Weizmannia acidilactici TaxID=2607726 RepID=A0A5J4JDH7_9BACI|nr:DUF4021 domain-containing protein [Weizmannia acidilactici]GER66506.1 hypothetical protein BpJC4_09770 [Weizmannia acidilactici]GER69349.1 hypothetical protein BpJC7_06520 [Weizmannia acidilactici]GER72324.1 hypothetical protein BpPP18_03910 [Weizmannia acidilactici]
MKENKEQQKKNSNSQNDFGADIDELAMNGSYGMLETEEADKSSE